MIRRLGTACGLAAMAMLGGMALQVCTPTPLEGDGAISKLFDAFVRDAATEAGAAKDAAADSSGSTRLDALEKSVKALEARHPRIVTKQIVEANPQAITGKLGAGYVALSRQSVKLKKRFADTELRVVWSNTFHVNARKTAAKSASCEWHLFFSVDGGVAESCAAPVRTPFGAPIYLLIQGAPPEKTDPNKYTDLAGAARRHTLVGYCSGTKSTTKFAAGQVVKVEAKAKASDGTVCTVGGGSGAIMEIEEVRVAPSAP